MRLGCGSTTLQLIAAMPEMAWMRPIGRIRKRETWGTRRKDSKECSLFWHAVLWACLGEWQPLFFQLTHVRVGPPTKVFAGITGCSSFSLLTSAGTIHRCNCLAFKTRHWKAVTSSLNVVSKDKKGTKKIPTRPQGQSCVLPPEAWKLEGSAQFLRCSWDSSVQMSGSWLQVLPHYHRDHCCFHSPHHLHHNCVQLVSHHQFVGPYLEVPPQPWGF